MDKTFEYILTQLRKPLYSHELNSVYALLNMMNDEELKSVKERLQSIIDHIYDDLAAQSEYNEESIECVLDFIKDTLKSRNISPNRSVTELLELLTKKCENRLSIVAELCERFEHQSFEDQKRIIKSLLRYEHDYISHAIMNDYWGEILIDDIVEMWQWCKDRSYNRYIIKYAKEEFVWEHIEEFSITKWDYELLCRRLGNHPDFKIDQSKLHNKFRYYSVLKSLGREVDNEAILGELFSYIRDWIVAPNRYLAMIEHELSITYPSEFYISSKLIPMVRDAIWSLSNMKLSEELLFFYEWDANIRQKVNNILNERYAGIEYNPSIAEMWSLYCALARELFPERYVFLLSEDTRQAKRRNEMLDELKPFIEQFGFEIEEDAEDLGLYEDKPLSPSNDYTITMPSLDEVPF